MEDDRTQFLDIVNDDDECFIHLARRVLQWIINQIDPNEVIVTRVDDVFDHKWLGFSGLKQIPFDGILMRDSESRQSVQRAPSSFPSFHPRQIKDCLRFVRDENQYTLVEPKLDSPAAESPSGTESLRNLLARNLASGDRQGSSESATVYAWFSGNSNENARGSLMVASVNSP